MFEQENPEPLNESALPTQESKTKNKSKKSYVVKGLLLCVVCFLLWTVIAPQFECWGCGSRAYDSDSKANLHNVYLACISYWSDYGPDQVCGMDFATSTAYGYIQTRNVRVIVYGNEKSFVGLAYNIKNNKAWKIDAKGTIE